jgi:hypothetical protein
VVNKVCLNCGVIFRVANYRKDTAKYCSRSCSSARSRTSKECKFCKEKFETWKSTFDRTKFCSKKCQLAYNKDRSSKIICLNCKDSFVVPFFKRNSAKFCSKRCQREFTNSDTKLKCFVCGENFTRKKWATINKKNVHYCSVDCYQKRSPSTYETCSCGNVFKVYASRKKYYKNLYCSVECRNKYGIIGRLTSNINFNKQYQKFVRSVRHSSKYYEWRKKCLERDNYKCNICHGDRGLTVHHGIKTMYDFVKEHGFNKKKIYNDCMFFDVDNGSTLCRKCHLNKHSNRNLKD